MNFDDLHDPQPPGPGPAALAAVTGRARQLRRRRATLVAGGGLLAVAAVVVPATLAVTGGDDGGRLVPGSLPAVAVATTPSTTVAPAGPATALPPQRTPTVPTTAPALLPAGVVAIRASGDAVHLDAQGRETLLFDGADPNVQPEEGELTVVDSVVRTRDGRTFVSTCCEPVPGSSVEIGPDGQPVEASLIYGHALALSPDGTRIASVGAQGLTVADLDGNVLANADLSPVPEGRQPEHVMWLDDDTLAVIELRSPANDDGGGFWLATVDAGLSGVADAIGVNIGSQFETTWPRFGGLADDGSILVFRGERGGDVADRLEAYDPATLTARPGSDVALPGPAVSAWYRDGLLTWVGADDALWVDGFQVRGEYTWARPVG